jgi:negative regulator of genetic competence, sporulation and motility
MIELIEFAELKNKLSDIITEKHHTDNLVDILIFKSKVNGEMKIEDQEKLRELNKKSEELSDKEKEIRERMEELRGEN